MKYSNIEMERMAAMLEPYLGRTDKIGYAAARNTRILRDEIAEYIARKRELMAQYGEPQKDSDGNPTGMVELRFDSPNYQKFVSDIEEWALIEHEPELFAIPVGYADGKLSGTELLNLEWMFDWSEE